MNEEFIDRLAAMSLLVKPGEDAVMLMHLGEDDKVGGGYGPFVDEEEAKVWQHAYDLAVGPCSCRKVVVSVTVPRLLAFVGPTTVPTTGGGNDYAKDRLN